MVYILNYALHPPPLFLKSSKTAKLEGYRQVNLLFFSFFLSCIFYSLAQVSHHCFSFGLFTAIYIPQAALSRADIARMELSCALSTAEFGDSTAEAKGSDFLNYGAKNSGNVTRRGNMFLKVKLYTTTST